jgi:hypothetical protein
VLGMLSDASLCDRLPGTSACDPEAQEPNWAVMRR